MSRAKAAAPEVPKEEPSTEARQELAWLKLKAHWVLESQMLIIHDFLKEEKLFGKLTAFAQKRKRM